MTGGFKSSSAIGGGGGGSTFGYSIVFYDYCCYILNINTI